MSDAHDRPSVVITGVGLVSARGIGRAGHQGPLVAAEPTELKLFDAATMPATVAYQVQKVRPQPYMLRRKDLKLMSRDARLAVQAAGLAIEDAGLDPKDGQQWPDKPENVGLFMGVGLEPGDIVELGLVMADSSKDDHVDLQRLGSEGIGLIPPLSSLKTLPNMALAHVSINFGLMGPGEALSPWGASTLQALAAAVESIERGECVMALVGGADSDVDLGGISTHLRTGLAARVTDAGGVSDGLEGVVMGEGAGFFVLESARSAAQRGARVWGTVAGCATAFAHSPEVIGFDAQGAAELVGPLVSGAEAPVKVVSAAGHHQVWRVAEAKALEPLGVQVVRPSEAMGHCVAASGILDLAAAMVSDEGQGPVSLIGLGWGSSGEWAAARIDVSGAEG